jgi:transglutaminase-like putative cysteine protease
VSPQPRDAADPVLPLAIARAIGFFALAGFAALHWMAMLQPGAPGRAGAALLFAALAAAALVGARRLPGRTRWVAAALIAVAALVLALVAGGVTGTDLRVSRWDELAGGISRGIEALPGVRVPYRGVDGWIRLVIPLGGTTLVMVAALLAFWPRRERLGWPLVALLLLVVLYVVPTVTLIFAGEFLRGAVLAALVVVFLRLEKLRLRDARLAGALAGVVVLGGLLVAPLINADHPWWDYEAWALDASTSKTTSYSWNHSYGPLDWPRDGREMLRVQAKRPAYWKAENLDDFNGRVWEHSGGEAPVTASTPSDPATIRRWTERIRVTVENLRTPEFITGGFAFGVQAPGTHPEPQSDGTLISNRTLQRGDSYTAAIYSPQPTERERHAAPRFDSVPVFPFLQLTLPQTPPRPEDPVTSDLVTFPRYGSGGRPTTAVEGSPAAARAQARLVLDDGPYAGVWRLAQRLKRGTEDQEDYVARILRYLGGSQFSYTEAPPRAAETLAGFLLKARTGYCQQYSGAMALLLRMGGVPARVSTGFTSGALDRRADEYVVRDLDAHSWVEVWYAGIGWVTFDPTPAAAPPRAQPDEAGTTGVTTSTPRAPLLPGDKGSSRASIAVAAPSAPWWRIPLLAVLGLLAAAAGTLAWRRLRRPATPAVLELERALRRTRRDGDPRTTLTALESAFARSPAAAGYVRAVREARYGGRPGSPTRSQRRALRAELGRGRGVGGRLRAWWALPPL